MDASVRPLLTDEEQAAARLGKRFFIYLEVEVASVKALLVAEEVGGWTNLRPLDTGFSLKLYQAYNRGIWHCVDEGITIQVRMSWSV